MNKILLVEPDYRSKFPPLGLMKLSTYHKSQGDRVAFVRGMVQEMRESHWDRIYISSLFTWELPKTVRTIKYYHNSVANPQKIFVGGTGVTLLPAYISDNVDCTLIEGLLDKPGMLDDGSIVIAGLVPDYGILEEVEYDYFPNDAYFSRITKGCIRKCEFCAVPILENNFGYLKGVKDQVNIIDKQFGQKQHLVVMDNNILGIDCMEDIIAEIAQLGFHRGAKRNGRQRFVDFNQGLDARLISGNRELAKLLGSISVSPIRLALDFIGMRKQYERAVLLLKDEGFIEFTNYMLFNFKDTPEELYNRMMINAELNDKHNIRITGFPMRFIPMDNVSRSYVSARWKWRYLRGIQCVLLATKGLVSPNPIFVKGAFGSNYEEFLETLSMPDRYIVYRSDYKDHGADDWRALYRKLSLSQREELYDILEYLNQNWRVRKSKVQKVRKYRDIIEHYYPRGETPPRTPKEDVLLQQGVSVGYDGGPG